MMISRNIFTLFLMVFCLVSCNSYKTRYVFALPLIDYNDNIDKEKQQSMYTTSYGKGYFYKEEPGFRSELYLIKTFDDSKFVEFIGLMIIDQNNKVIFVFPQLPNDVIKDIGETDYNQKEALAKKMGIIINNDYYQKTDVEGNSLGYYPFPDAQYVSWDEKYYIINKEKIFWKLGNDIVQDKMGNTLKRYNKNIKGYITNLPKALDKNIHLIDSKFGEKLFKEQSRYIDKKEAEKHIIKKPEYDSRGLY